MKQRSINTQLNNLSTYKMYLRQMRTLAQTVISIKNLPDFIDTAYINKILVNEGSIAFFEDEVLGLVALPYAATGHLDVYGRPTQIRVMGDNGYHRTLKNGEFVILYDNEGRYPILLDLLQYALRVADIQRTIDTNIHQQKTPRIWKTSQDQEMTVKALVNNIDSNYERVVVDKHLEIDDIQAVVAPAPYVADKLSEQKEKIWNEMLRLIGVANTNFQKKERNIKDEIFMSQGGTVASRLNRFDSRAKGLELINKKFGTDLKAVFYDGLDTELRDPNEDGLEDFDEEDDSDD